MKRNGRRKITQIEPDIVEKVVNMYENGLSVHHIGKELYVSDYVVKNILIDEKKFIPRPEMMQIRDKKIFHDHIFKGYSYNKLSIVYKLSYDSIDNIIHKFLSDRATLRSKSVVVEELVKQGMDVDDIINSTAFSENDIRFIIKAINRKRFISEDLKDRIVDDYTKGVKLRIIANKHYVNSTTIDRILCERNVERNRKIR